MDDREFTFSDPTDGFVEFYSISRPRLIVGLRSLASSPEVASDVADEALVRAYERWDRVGSMRSPLGWTFVTARNILRRRERRSRLERALTQQHSYPDTVETLGPLVEFVSAISALPKTQRDVLVCRHVLMLSEPEIASSLRIPRGTVSSRLRRAHARLRAAQSAERSTPSIRPNAVAPEV